MTSDNTAALNEIRRTGDAFVLALESLFRSGSVNQQTLATAYRTALYAITLAERAVTEETESAVADLLKRDRSE